MDVKEVVTVIQGFNQSPNLSDCSTIESQQINYSSSSFIWVLCIRLDRRIMYVYKKIKLV